ncbi:MAG: hypothetical protein ACSW8F_05765 [bacterium]
MSDRARGAMRLALEGSCGVLAAILVILAYIGGPETHTYALWRLVCELWRVPVGVMLLASLSVLATEERR